MKTTRKPKERERERESEHRSRSYRCPREQRTSAYVYVGHRFFESRSALGGAHKSRFFHIEKDYERKEEEEGEGEKKKEERFGLERCDEQSPLPAVRETQ